MALKGRYILELKDNAGAENVARTLARLEGDAPLREAAARRKKYGGDERWWSVGAGVIIVLLLIAYSLDWKAVSIVLSVGLVIYLAVVFSYIIIKRLILKRTRREISPHLGVDTLMRMALGQKARDADIGRLFDAACLAAFSAELKKHCVACAQECGVNPENWELKTELNLRQMQSAQRDVVLLPVVATITAKDAGGECEIILEYMAAFVSASTGDYLPVDCAPEIKLVLKREARLHEQPALAVSFVKCPRCGTYMSERALKACEGACMECHGNI